MDDSEKGIEWASNRTDHIVFSSNVFCAADDVYVDAITVSEDFEGAGGEDAGGWSIDTAAATWSATAENDMVWSIADGTIEYSMPVDLPKETTIGGIPIQQLLKQEVQPMWTTSNILIVVLIVIVTTKVIMPRLNWRWWVKKFKNYVFKPAKAQVDEIETAWKDEE